MAVQNQTPVASFTTSGVTTVFPFAFMLLDADDLVVTLDGVTVSSGFGIAGIGAPAGGSVVFTTAPAPGQLLVLRRNIALQRLNDYQRNGDLLAQVLNLDLDRIWQALQGLRLDATRALKLPEDTLTDQTIDDDAAARAGKLVGFDGSGNVVAVSISSPGDLLVSAFIESLLPSVDAASARSILGAVGKSGADTIDGPKTFTSSPTIPDGTDAAHAASVGQLQDEADARDTAISDALALALLPNTLVPTLSDDMGADVPTTSGTSHPVTGIPSWALCIYIDLLGVSVSGTDNFGFQVGNSGGFATSGYAGSVSGGTNTVAFSNAFATMQSNAPAGVWQGQITLRRARASDTTWSYVATANRSDGASVAHVGAGSVTISNLDRVRIAMLSGSSTFDAGSFRVRAGI